MRHVNPVRQSGPLPSYYGTYTMEDIKKLFDQTTMGKDVHYCQMDVDEVMRRVPGVTFPLCRSQEGKFSILSRSALARSNRSDTRTWPTILVWMSSTNPMESMSPGKLWQTPRDKR